jgi:flagellar basal body P-ring formation protein FlgA
VKKSNEMLKTARLVFSVVFLFLFSGHLCIASAAVIKAERLKAAVRAYIETNMPWQKDTLRVEFSRTVANVSLPGKKIVCRVLSNRNMDFIGDSSFTIKFYENDVFLKQKTIKTRLEVSMNVVVSAKSLPRNIKIDRKDVKQVKRWFNRIPSNIISNLDDVVGMKLRTRVKSNTRIKRNMVRTIPLVTRGKPVKIIFNNGLMSITTIGLSEQDGVRGDLIKVRNVSSKKVIYARVLDNSLVKMEL